MEADLRITQSTLSQMSLDEAHAYFAGIATQARNELVAVEWVVDYDKVNRCMVSVADVALAVKGDALLQVWLSAVQPGIMIPEQRRWETAAVEFKPEQLVSLAKIGHFDAKWTEADYGLKYIYRLWGYVKHGDEDPPPSFFFAKSYVFPGGPAEDTSPVAHFVFEQESPTGELCEFVFELRGAAKIAEARAILADSDRLARNHVQGTIVQSPASYNPRWSFHLDPATISFFEYQREACDANMTYLERHLDEIGGSTLPGGFWCPYSSRLVRELPTKT